MTFDAAGNLIETDDGGIYRRTNPATAAGDWFSVIGDLQVTEMHDVSYDTLSDIAFVGTQDNDDPHQDTHEQAGVVRAALRRRRRHRGRQPDSRAPHTSIRYDSAQNLQAFVRTFWDHANDLLGFVFPDLAPLGGGPPCSGQFVTPVEINAVQPTRLIFGCANGIYETFDQGDTIRRISTLVINGSGVDPVSYGGLGNPDLLVVGVTDRVFIRTAAHPAPLVQTATYPGTGTGRTVTDIVIDPDDANTFYLVNLTEVYRTLDGGATWTNVTGNLQSFAPIALRGDRLRPAHHRTTPWWWAPSTASTWRTRASGFTVWSPSGPACRPCRSSTWTTTQRRRAGRRHPRPRRLVAERGQRLSRSSRSFGAPGGSPRGRFLWRGET